MIQKLLTKCSQLTELNMRKGVGSLIFGHKMLLDPHVCALVDNLTPDILKLNLSSQRCVTDKHVSTLVHRCNKITELDLGFTEVTNDSVDSIVEHLNSLEKLSVNYTKIDFSKLLQLKSISTLKILRCSYGRHRSTEHTEKIKNLKLQLPHIRINEDYIQIACPTKEVNGSIKAKEQDLFPKAY